MRKKIIKILVLILFFPILSSAQKNTDVVQPEGQLMSETIDDEYIFVPRNAMKTSKAYRYSSTDIITVQVNVNENGENMMGDAANEPSIAFDHNDHNYMVIGWRQFDTIASNFRQAGYGFTTDGGTTWTFPGVIEPGVFRSDPVLDADKSGNFYFNSLTVDTTGFKCNVFFSGNQGAGWNAGTFAYGGDKPWMTIDKTGGPGSGNIYVNWGASTLCPFDEFTRSTDGNASYEYCSPILEDPIIGTSVVSADGKLYVAGKYDTNFIVTRSSNAQFPGQTVVWDMETPVSLDGKMFLGSPNPSGILGQAIVTADSSGTETNGNVYLLCSVERFSNDDPCDVMFSRSTDEGETWSDPIRVNDDPGQEAYQWFGTMSVAPDGRIDVIWLDTRNHPGTVVSELYYAYSTNGGVTWSINESLSEPFDPHLGYPNQNKIGDYYHMYSDSEGAHLAWAATFNEEQDIYYSFISGLTGLNNHTVGSSKIYLAQNFPNPFKNKTTIRYTVRSSAMTTLLLTDVQGNVINMLVHKVQAPGFYQIELKSENLDPGLYYYTLTTGQIRETRKLVLLN